MLPECYIFDKKVYNLLESDYKGKPTKTVYTIKRFTKKFRPGYFKM